jgi:hypothetical protein
MVEVLLGIGVAGACLGVFLVYSGQGKTFESVQWTEGEVEAKTRRATRLEKEEKEAVEKEKARTRVVVKEILGEIEEELKNPTPEEELNIKE